MAVQLAKMGKKIMKNLPKIAKHTSSMIIVTQMGNCFPVSQNLLTQLGLSVMRGWKIIDKFTLRHGSV
jgi:hypothetical protein